MNASLGTKQIMEIKTTGQTGPANSKLKSKFSKISIFRIGRSVMERLRMPQHADTDVSLRIQAVLLSEKRKRTFSHEPFILNKAKIEQTTLQKPQCSDEGVRALSAWH